MAQMTASDAVIWAPFMCGEGGCGVLTIFVAFVMVGGGGWWWLMVVSVRHQPHKGGSHRS